MSHKAFVIEGHTGDGSDRRGVREVLVVTSRDEAIVWARERGLTVTSLDPAPPALAAAALASHEKAAAAARRAGTAPGAEGGGGGVGDEGWKDSRLLTHPVWTIAMGVVVGLLLWTAPALLLSLIIFGLSQCKG